MNNYGIDVATWESLKKKWSELESAGHKLEVDFKLIVDPKDEEHVLAIDVIQHIDDDIITETVQRSAGEAYATLGISELSMEGLVAVYKQRMEQLRLQQAKPHDTNLVVMMTPSSETSGEIQGYVEKPDGRNSVLVNYHHYYILNALRNKMIEVLGDAWTQVRAIHGSNGMEFYFDY